jgi:hypothetical protein
VVEVSEWGWDEGNLESEEYIPLVQWPHMSVRFGGLAGAGMLLFYPSTFARWAQLCTRTRARGHKFTPVSAPTGSGARGYTGFFCPLPSLAIIAYPTSLLGKAHLIAFQTEISHISSRLSLAIFEE